MTTSLPYVLRNLSRRRTRTLVGVLGILLTTALLTAIQIGLDSVATSYIDLVALQAGKADLLIAKPGTNPMNPAAFEPAEVRSQVETNLQVRGLSPRLVGLAQVRFGRQSPYAILIGLNTQREEELDISGMMPAPNLREGVCALSRSLAAKLQAKTGANLRIFSPGTGTEMALRLEAIVERQMILPQQVKDYVVVNEATARSIFNEPRRVHVLAGAFHHPQGYYDARDLHASVLRLKKAGEAIAADVGTEYEVRLPKAAAITAFQHFTSPLRAVFGVFALLALAVTGLLIYSLISISVEERIREYAILRTLGARKRYIFRLVLTESIIICCLGVAPGVLAGSVLAQGIVKLLELAMKTDSIRLAISPATFWMMLAAGAVLAIGSALAPALQTTRWRIVDALDPLRRGQITIREVKEGQARRPLVISGLVLSSLSVIVLFVLPTAFLSGNPSLIGTVLLCLLLSILLGLTLAMLGVSPMVERWVLYGVGWAFQPITEMVGRNLDRHRRRNTTTALMYCLSVSLVVFIASLAVLFSRTSLAMVEHQYGADIRIQSPQEGAGTLNAELQLIDGVAAVSTARFLRGRSDAGIAYDVVMSDLVGMKHLWIVPYGVDREWGQVVYTNQIIYHGGGPGAVAELAGKADAVPKVERQTNREPPLILSYSAAQYLDIEVEDLVQVSFQLGAERKTKRFRVQAVCSSMPGLENFRARIAHAFGSGALMSMDDFNDLSGSAPPEAFRSYIFVKAKGNEASQKALAHRLREETEARFRFAVQCTAEQKEQARALYWVTQIFFGLMLGVAVIIAVFALIASMASTAIERRWEIGVLKALGLRRRLLFRLFLGEAITLTLSSGLAGGAIGFILAYLFMLQAAVLMEIAVVFTMPYLTFLATFIISIVAGAVAAHLPTRRLLRKPAAEILRMEE